MNIPLVIQYKYPTAVALVDYTVSDNGKGPFISQWNVAKLGPQPQASDLAGFSNEPGYATFLTTQTPTYQAALAAANHPIMQYLLTQLQVAVPGYVVPTTQQIITAINQQLNVVTPPV